MILACQNISKAFGTTEIIKNASFHIEEREKAALVGINGAGKSTLLKIIIGEMRADEGEVILSKGKTMGYLAQHQDLTGHLSIYQEVLTAKQNLIDMEERLRQMESDMNTKSGAELDELLSTYTRLSHTFELENGYAYRSEVVGVLKGLGFSESDFEKQVDSLSGGQKTRVALGKLLLTKPDIILLDEPTNHLDIPSREALEAALLDFGGTMLVVSHDRYFINKLSTRVLSIGMGGAESFDGGYDDYAARIAEQSAEKPKTAKTVGKGGEDYKRRKERESELRRTATAIKRCEERINELDELIANTNAEMSTPETAADYARVMELTETLGKLNGEQTELMLQWEELENRKAQLEGEE